MRSGISSTGGSAGLLEDQGVALEPDRRGLAGQLVLALEPPEIIGVGELPVGRLAKTIGLTLGSSGTATASTSPLTLVWNWIFQLMSASAGSLSALGALKTS